MMNTTLPNAGTADESSRPQAATIKVWKGALADSVPRLRFLAFGLVFAALLIGFQESKGLVGWPTSMIVLGGLAGFAVLLGERWRVTASDDGVVVRHLFSHSFIPWSQVTGIQARGLGRSAQITTSGGVQIHSHAFRSNSSARANAFLEIARQHGAPISA